MSPGDEPGREVLGPYVLLETLGRGGMGVVYAALDPDLDRKIALKLLRTDKIRDPEARRRDRARLVQEAQAMARLDHPNVVTVHDVGTIDGRVFIAMEFIDGETLGVWIRRGPHDAEETLRVMLPAARGLSAAHEAGLVHRDFKPDNVLLDRHGGVFVLDFGLAIGADISRSARHDLEGDSSSGDPNRGSSAPGDSSATMSSGSGASNPSSTDAKKGWVLGTPAYMSPEQHRGQAVDARSDQFSWCVATWEALYGQRPFGGRNRSAIAFQVVRGELVPPPAGIAVPPHIHGALVRGLRSDPQRRWPSMDALVDAIGGAARRRRRRTVLVAGATALAAAGVVTALWWPSVEPEAVCREPADDVGGVFDGARRTAVAERLAPAKTHDGPHAAAAYLDAWARAWSEVQFEACEATFVRREQSRDLFGRQERCLARRRAELSDVLDLIVDDDIEPGLAGAIVSGLEAPQACRDRSSLLAASATDPLGDVDPTLLRRLERARLLARAGLLDRATALAAETLDAAEASAEPDAVARASLIAGDVARRADDPERARLLLDRAAQLSMGLGHDLLAVRAWTSLVWLGVDDDERLDEALEFGRYADAGLRRLEHEGHTQGIARARGALLLAMGSLLERRGELAPSEQHLSAAISDLERVPLGAELTSAHALARRGAVRGRRGRLAEARADLDASLAILDRWGIDPAAGPATEARRWRADVALAAGDLDLAEADYRALLDLADARPDGAHLRAMAHTGLGEVSLARDDVEAAERHLRRSLEHWSNTAPAPGDLARTRFSLAECLARRDPRSEEARSEARRARELFRRGAPLERGTVPIVERWLAGLDERVDADPPPPG